MKSRLREAEQRYRNELLDNVLPFWLKKSPDQKYGGYFSCLDREGNVYDTDKFIWLQSRQVWLFSMLYNHLEQKPEWLESARQGGEFLLQHGHDGGYNWYFSLNRQGEPLIHPYNIFSFTFVAMGLGQLHLATGIDEYGVGARETWKKILGRQENPKSIWNKAVPGTRKLKNFALPMILLNLALEIEHLLGEEEVEKTADRTIAQIMNVFYRPELDLVVENVTTENELHDSFDGRLLIPGHTIEAMWFIMDLSERLNRPELAEEAVRITLSTLDYGWDKSYGGIYYFMDRDGHPPQQLEWSQKLWWVHIETLVALLKGYHLTGSEKCMEWFWKIDSYCWTRFKDAEFPEWYGYLDRQGEVNLPLKGGKWKGCFHVPRGLYQCWQTLNRINRSSQSNTL